MSISHPPNSQRGRSPATTQSIRPCCLSKHCNFPPPAYHRVSRRRHRTFAIRSVIDNSRSQSRLAVVAKRRHAIECSAMWTSMGDKEIFSSIQPIARADTCIALRLQHLSSSIPPGLTSEATVYHRSESQWRGLKNSQGVSGDSRAVSSQSLAELSVVGI